MTHTTEELYDYLQSGQMYKTENAKKIMTLKKANMARSLRDIGTEVGVSPEYVRQVFNYNGIKPLNRKDAFKYQKKHRGDNGIHNSY